MPVPLLRACSVRSVSTAVVLVTLLAGCATGGPDPAEPAAAAPPVVDPVAAPQDGPDREDAPAGSTIADGPHEISLVADFGPLPDGSGHAVVETTWSTDAQGVQRLVVDTPAGRAVHHVMTEDEHWWWLPPDVRATVADAEWIHFDLPAIDAVGGELPDLVAEARTPVPHPHEIVVGQIVAGTEVLAIEVVDDDEVHLTVAGVERPVVHRRRALPAATTIEVPSGAVDVADLPGVLRW